MGATLSRFDSGRRHKKSLADRIDDFQEWKKSEVGIARVYLAQTVLFEEGGDVGIMHQISLRNPEKPQDVLEHLAMSFPFIKDLHVR